MPSRARQGITVFKNKSVNNGKALILIRKTGFVDLWWFDKHYYTENGFLMVEPVDFDKMVDGYNQKQQAKKRIVIIRR